MSINLSAITAFLDKTLSVDSLPDASRALNGLQLENEGAVSKIAVAVDGSERTTMRPWFWAQTCLFCITASSGRTCSP